MRRTLGTHLQHHGTLKDAQGALRHASIQTTGDVYMQAIEGSVLQALNSRTSEILSDWKPTLVSGGQPINGESAAPKRRNVNLARGLDQNGPSVDFEGECKCLNLMVDAVGIEPTTCRLREQYLTYFQRLTRNGWQPKVLKGNNR